MNLNNSLIYFLILLVFIPAGCTRYAIEGFDHKHWKSDKWGCENIRKEMVQTLQRHKSELLELNVKEVSKLLGNPDKHELLERNKRLFTYYTSPGLPCDNMEQDPENRNRLDIMIGPLGEVVDITFYE